MKTKKNLKNLLKNSWDILPGINEFQLFKNAKRAGDNLYYNLNRKDPSFLKTLGRVFLTSAYITYGIVSCAHDSLNPKVWNANMKENYTIMQEKQRYENKVDSAYDSLFKDAENFQDSLEIYQKYGLPIKLEDPSFKEKERITGHKNLEDDLK